MAKIQHPHKMEKPRNPHKYRLRGMVAGEGFEPSQTESESVVLPLHNPAKWTALIIITINPIMSIPAYNIFIFPHWAVRSPSGGNDLNFSENYANINTFHMPLWRNRQTQGT